MFAIALAAVFATPLLYLAYNVVSVEHYRLQTWLMHIGGPALASFWLVRLLSGPGPGP